jgi:DNA polymerase III alpha subunit
MNITWSEMLFKVIPGLNKTMSKNLIESGAMSLFGVSRSEMSHHVSSLITAKGAMTKKELEGLVSLINEDNKNDPIFMHVENLLSKGTKKEGGFISSDRRRDKVKMLLSQLKNPGRSLSDDPAIYARAEEKLLGVEINHSQLSACSDASFADTTCKEVSEGKTSKSTLAVIIKRVKTHKTTKGDIMAFLSIEDESGELENIVIFTELYGQHKDIIYEESTVLMSGEIKDKTRKSFIIESIFQI